MKLWPRIIALMLPLVALAASWGFTHYKAQQGIVWRVPISGYDPRDLLRGHYVVYRYDWPGLSNSEDRSYVSELCIKGKAPTIDTTSISERPSAEPAPKSTCAITARVAPGSDADLGLLTGKIYIAQTKADALQKKLLDPKLQAFVHIRIRDDGIVTPIELSFARRGTPLVP